MTYPTAGKSHDAAPDVDGVRPSRWFLKEVAGLGWLSARASRGLCLWVIGPTQRPTSMHTTTAVFLQLQLRCMHLSGLLPLTCS